MRLGNDSDADWERLGRHDPYYGVYADRKFHVSNLTPETVAEFFESGRIHVEAVFERIEAARRRPVRPRRALEFGCGVGRVLIPLAARCEAVVGVDVSPAMLAEARKNLDARCVGNVELVLGDDALAAVAGEFDLVHSFVVFQHVDPARGERLLRALVARLAAEGVGVIQLTYSSDRPLRSRLVAWGRRNLPLFHGLWNWRHGKRWDSPWMQMNRYDLNRVLRILQDLGCHRVELRFTEHFGHRGVVLFFEKAAEPSFPPPPRRRDP